MNIEEFKQQSLEQIKNYPLSLQALWHDYQGDWNSSHKLIDQESDKLRFPSVRDCAWVHAQQFSL